MSAALKEKDSPVAGINFSSLSLHRSPFPLQRHASTTTLIPTPQQSPPPRMSLVKQASLPDMYVSALDNMLEGSPVGKPGRQMQLPDVKQMFSQKEKERISPSFASLTASNLRNSNSINGSTSSSREDDPRLVAMESYYFVISRDNSKSDVYSSPSMSPRDTVALQVAESVLDGTPAPKLNRKSLSSPFLNAHHPLDPGYSNSKLLAALEAQSTPLSDEETKFYGGVCNY